MMRFLSLGAGVQSSTLALMIAHGELPPIDAAIFADTQWEPVQVYQWLDRLTEEIARLPHQFPVHRVTQGNLRELAMNGVNIDGGRFTSIPWHILNPDGSHGIGRRQCTREFKLGPLVQAKRRLLGYPPRVHIPAGACETLIGISTDEASRMKDSAEKWNTNRWPLIELGMSRQDCLTWMREHGYPEPPKSSCLGCPLHNSEQWRAIKADPVAWADVVEVDKAIRIPRPGMRGKQFMHRSCLPLEEVDFSPKRRKKKQAEANLFELECEGMCGT